jgi:hypothetical protein
MRLGIPIYAMSNNLSWVMDLLDGRVKIINETGSAFDHFSLLISAKAIIQYTWGGWSSYSPVPALVSGAPMIKTYDVKQRHHRFHVFRSQLGVPTNYYDCKQALDFMQAIQTRSEHVPPVPPKVTNSAELLYASEGHRHLVSDRLHDRSLAIWTRWLQKVIHENQFVRDCSQRRLTGFDGRPRRVWMVSVCDGSDPTDPVFADILQWPPGLCVGSSGHGYVTSSKGKPNRLGPKRGHGAGCPRVKHWPF